jgi:Flp pilus assembly protein TadD
LLISRFGRVGNATAFRVLLPPHMKFSTRAKPRKPGARDFPVGQAVVEATCHLERGENERALALLEEVVHHAPNVPVFRYLLGVAQIRRQLNEAAIANFEMAVRGEPQNVDFLVALSGALLAARPQDAMAHLTRAVHLGTKQPQAYSQLAGLLIDARRPEEALPICDAGLAICGAGDPTGVAPILGTRGRALWSLARNQEALECLHIVEAALPRDSATMLAIGGVLLELGRVPEARVYMRRACDLAPESAVAHYSLGVVLLLEGDYREGFREYEFRWGVRELAGNRKPFPKPRWDGLALSGSRVLLHAEQGAGDTIQFVRYADFVKATGGKAILLAPASLGRLLSWLPGCEIAALNEPLPDFDFHCPLVSLPLLAGTDKNSIPPPARFVIPAEVELKWSGVFGEKTGLRVGLCWAGAPDHRNDRNRSFPCRVFAPLISSPLVPPEAAGTEWFSLQVGPAAAQIAEPGLRGKIRDLSPLLTDYAETAGAITQLDLVITADTSVAHLAGSLGKPVWVLTPFAPDWRWLLERADSPWYPSMRLFRQPAAGDWESVIGAVGAALWELPGFRPEEVPDLISTGL